MTRSIFLRWAILVAVVSAPSACGVERAVVATLDSAGAPAEQSPTEARGGNGGAAPAPPTATSAGGEAGGAPTFGFGGSSGFERGLGGAGGADPRNVGGSATDCLNVIDRAGGGAAGGDSGMASPMTCACLGQAPILLCGTDDVTYDAMCGDDCPQVEVACLHECPCEGAEPGSSTMTLWFPLDAETRAQCTEGFACIGFSSQTGVVESSCITISTDS